MCLLVFALIYATYYVVTYSVATYLSRKLPTTTHHKSANNMVTVYSTNSTRIPDDKLAAFLRSDIRNDLDCFYGIPEGGANEDHLNTSTLTDDFAFEGVENGFQLFGVFLMLKKTGMSSQEHCDRFYRWLAAQGVNSKRADIVRQIALKCDTFAPGLYTLEAVQEAHEAEAREAREAAETEAAETEKFETEQFETDETEYSDASSGDQDP
jgi:hypothetical protein